MARGDSGFKVEGLTQAIRDMRTLGVEVEDLKAAFTKIAAEGAERAASHAPVRSGRLSRSIRGNKAKSKAVVRAGTKRGAPHAGPINYGWPRRGIRASGFMQRADQDMQPRAVRMLEDEINNQIRKRRSLR